MKQSLSNGLLPQLCNWNCVFQPYVFAVCVCVCVMIGGAFGFAGENAAGLQDRNQTPQRPCEHTHTHTYRLVLAFKRALGCVFLPADLQVLNSAGKSQFCYLLYNNEVVKLALEPSNLPLNPQKRLSCDHKPPEVKCWRFFTTFTSNPEGCSRSQSSNASAEEVELTR